MTLKELANKTRIRWQGYGSYRVTIEYRGKVYTCTSHNSRAYDRISGSDDWSSEREVQCGYTLRQAFQALYDECKRVNELGVQHYIYFK